MNITDVDFDNVRPFDGYGPGFFRIGGDVVRGSLILHAAGLHPWGGYGDVAALLRLTPQVDVVLLGTGSDIAHIANDFRLAIEEAGLGIEVMATPAACRTYNVLIGEGRRVAAAVLPII